MNRGCDTHNKQTRRVRLWLKPSTWELIDQRAGELNWSDRRDQLVIERLIERWAQDQLDRASSARLGQ